MPDWRPIIQAANSSGIRPWELAGIYYPPGHPIPICWTNWILELEKVENIVRYELRLQAESGIDYLGRDANE